MRLLLLLLLCLGSLMGSAAPVAAHAPANPMAERMTGHCGGAHQGCPADHVCMGCAVSPDRMAAAPHIAPAPAPQPVAALVPALPDHRTGFDPPPPRIRA